MSKTSRFFLRALLSVITILIGLILIGCTQDNNIDITVSPNVLNLEANGGVFTIHADVKYHADSDVKVYLNNSLDSVSVLSTFADSRGDLVVKCDIHDVKEVVAEGSANVKLSVYTKDGVSYWGTDTIDVVSKGK